MYGDQFGEFVCGYWGLTGLKYLNSYLMVESSTSQNHGEFTGIFRAIQPLIVLCIPCMESARKTDDTISVFSPDSVLRQNVKSACVFKELSFTYQYVTGLIIIIGDELLLNFGAKFQH